MENSWIISFLCMCGCARACDNQSMIAFSIFNAYCSYNLNSLCSLDHVSNYSPDPYSSSSARNVNVSNQVDWHFQQWLQPKFMAHLRRVDNISFSFGSNRNKGQKRINHFLFCRFYDSKHPDAWNKWQNHILLGEKVFRNSFVFVCTSQTKRYAIMRTIWSSILVINLLLNGIDQNRVSRQMKSFQIDLWTNKTNGKGLMNIL